MPYLDGLFSLRHSSDIGKINGLSGRFGRLYFGVFLSFFIIYNDKNTIKMITILYLLKDTSC